MAQCELFVNGYAVLFFGAFMELLMRRVIFGCCLLFFALNGCQDRYQEGYDAGFRAGRQTGFVEGEASMKRHYEQRGIVRGSIFGMIFGAALIAFFTRSYLSERWRIFRRRKRISRLLVGLNCDLDNELYPRVYNLALRRAALCEQLARDKNNNVAELWNRLRFPFAQMESRIVKLAELLQGLQRLQNESPVNQNLSRARIETLEKDVARTADESQKALLKEALQVEQRRLATAEQNDVNAKRCLLKLSTLEAFLDTIAMSVSNLHALELADAFEPFEEKITKEVEELEEILQNALCELNGLERSLV